MADIDLYGNDATTIRNAYKSSLRRDASDDEVTGWLSGSYGGGGVNDWVNQIGNSHEAQQYKAPSGSPPPTPPVVGQPNPNVNTTLPASPTQPPSGSQMPAFSPWQMPPQNNQAGYYWNFDDDAQRQLAQWYWTYLGRMPGENDIRAHVSNPGGMSGIEQTIRSSPEAQAYGARQPTTPPGTGTTNVAGPQNGDFQSWFMSLTSGKAPTPEMLESLAPILQQYGIRIGSKGNRGWSDVIILPDGRMFDVIEAAGIGTGKRWVWQLVGGPGYVPQGGVGGGQVPGNQYSDPYTQLMEELIKARIQMLQGGINDPMRQQYMAGLQGRADQLGSAAEPAYQALIQRLEQRFNELQGPGYTGAENEAIRTQALDPIENDRQAARKRVMERMAAAGHTMESGVMQVALMEVDKAFDGMRGATQTTLTTNDLQRREGRQQRADSIRGTLYDIPQARAREQLDVFGAMDILEQAFRNEQQANSREAIGYSGALADLGPQRFQLAMQAAGMGGNPQSMFNSLYQMAQMNQTSALLNQRNSGQLWSGLGSMAYTLMNAGR